MKEGMKLNLPPKLLEKLVWVLDIWLCKKIFIPSYVFDALLCQKKTGHSQPLIVTLLQITLLFSLCYVISFVLLETIASGFFM
jgi:hypothetical protein